MLRSRPLLFTYLQRNSLSVSRVNFTKNKNTFPKVSRHLSLSATVLKTNRPWHSANDKGENFFAQFRQKVGRYLKHAPMLGKCT